MSTDIPADRRAGRTARGPRDLIISLTVLLVPILVLVGGYQILAGRTEPVAVDPAPALAAAEAGGLGVRTPEPPTGWVPISAVYGPEEQGGTVRIGYVTPGGGSVQLVQSNLPAEELLVTVLRGGLAPTGTVEVAGRQWQQYTTGQGERALVRLEPELTTVVVGRVDAAELVELAAAVG